MLLLTISEASVPVLQASAFHGGMTKREKAAAAQRALSSLAWVARRTGIATTSLALASTLSAACAPSARAISLVTAASAADLSGLRCLSFPPAGSEPALEGLLDWLLERAPRLQAMDLRVKTRHLPAGHISFRHMRHLVMTSHDLRGRFLVAEQLPALETLSIHGRYDTGAEVIDMSGCRRLRQLVLSRYIAKKLIWDAAGSGCCPVAFELHDPFVLSQPGRIRAFRKQAALAQHVILCVQDDGRRPVFGLFRYFPTMKVLALKWPARNHPGPPCPIAEDAFWEGAGDYLCDCIEGQSLVHLETIIITGCRMEARIPSADEVPNLKDLVIKASGQLELSFQIPFAISRISSLHLYGRPFVSHEFDLSSLKEHWSALEEHGLVLTFAATEPGSNRKPTSCIYLRPAGTQELSIDELCTKVEQLVQCRCGACFDCLRWAGCIDE